MLTLAVRNLFSRKMRSLLSILGTTVAIAGMVGLFSVSEGLARMVTSTFNRIPGLVAMQPGAPAPLLSQVPAAWGDEIAAMDGVRVVTPEIWERVNLIQGEPLLKNARFLYGIDIETRLQLGADVYRDDLQEGRYLTPEDAGTSNVVISRTISDEYGVGVGDPLSINGRKMPVVGIYETGSLFLDIAIVLSMETLRDYGAIGDDRVSSFYIEVDEGVEPEDLADPIQRRFVGRDPIRQRTVTGFLDWLLAGWRPTPRSLGTVGKTEEGESPLEVRSASQMAGRVMKFSKNMKIFLGIVTGIGITVAVLSIVNTMLMSVSERMIEFGILKANGWSAGDVLKLITWESAVLGSVGGILGCFFGWTTTEILNRTFPDQVSLYASPMLLSISFLFSTIMGVLGGLYPAIWAARMMPMDAIRRG